MTIDPVLDEAKEIAKNRAYTVPYSSCYRVKKSLFSDEQIEALESDGWCESWIFDLIYAPDDWTPEKS